MHIKKYIVSTLAICATYCSYGQDLISRVPQEAKIVAVINHDAIVKNSSLEMLNKAFVKLGLFETLANEKNIHTESIADLPIALDRSSYVYYAQTDSINYTGILIPLKKNHNIADILFKDYESFVGLKGYESKRSSDQKTNIAWNDNMLFIMTGEIEKKFFENPVNAARYGMEVQDDYVSMYEELFEEAPAVSDSSDEDDWKYNEEEEIEDVEWEADSLEDFDIESDSAATALEGYDWDDYDLSDLETDYAAMSSTNDSLQNSLLTQWSTDRFLLFLEPAHNNAKNKGLKNFNKKNTLVHFWMTDLDAFYKKSLPADVINLRFGLQTNEFSTGYTDLTLSLTQKANQLRVESSLGVDRDIEKMLKNVFKSKVNRRFAHYVPDEHLGYFSLNMNTEAYLKSLPKFIERWYAPLVAQYKEPLSIAAIATDVFFDEKAIANLANGDFVFFVNDVKKVQTEYIDYEYDENYDYTEVTKTKEEYIPSFLSMFTSKDQRLYKKIADYGVQKDELELIDGIYKLNVKDAGFATYLLFKDDIVFLGSELEQLVAIRNNNFKSRSGHSILKEINGNSFTAVAHAEKIPETFKKLGIPIVKSFEKDFEELSHFGALKTEVGAIKKGRIESAISFDLPKKENSAIRYLLNKILSSQDGMIETLF